MNHASIERRIKKGFVPTLKLPALNRVASPVNFRLVIDSWVFDKKVALGGIIGGLVPAAVSYPYAWLVEALTTVQSTTAQAEALAVLVLYGGVAGSITGAMTQMRREGDSMATQGYFRIRDGEFVDSEDSIAPHLSHKADLGEKPTAKRAGQVVQNSLLHLLRYPITGSDLQKGVRLPAASWYNMYFRAENGQFVFGKDQFVGSGISPKTGLEISPRERVLKGLQLVRRLTRHHFSNSRFPD